MIVLKIENVKEFMQHLFQTDMFDKFCVGRCEVTTFVNFTTDCRKNPDWYDSDEKQGETGILVRWLELKPVIFSLIKGRKTPSRLAVDLCYYMPDGDMGSMRIQFENGSLIVYTGYMQHEFTLDRGKQQNWDENCITFLKKNEIVSTLLE